MLAYSGGTESPKIKLTHSGKSVADTRSSTSKSFVLLSHKGVPALAPITVTKKLVIPVSRLYIPYRPFPHPFHLRGVEIHRSEGLGLWLWLWGKGRREV